MEKCMDKYVTQKSREHSSGKVTAVVTLANGFRDKFQGEEYIRGATGESMKASTCKIRNRATVSTNGGMGESMKECGGMGNNTERAFTQTWMGRKGAAFGMTGKG